MEEFLSLYDYLGCAAGIELGKQVATYASELKVGFKIRPISNAKYTGNVMTYPKSFLEWYFKESDTEGLTYGKSKK